MKITRCKTNHLINPLGFELSRPVLTWNVEDARGKKQEAARIVVAADEALSRVLLDTGFSSDISCLGFPVELPQSPRTRYFWQVSVRDDAGDEAISDVQYYETAKVDEPWQAKWIGRHCSGRLPVFEKTLELKASPASARLYITGLGLYDARIDGVPVSDEYLTPFCNNYNAFTQYQTFDVTAMVKTGSVLSVTLGDGWYAGRFGFHGARNHYGSVLKLLAELRLRFADGSEQVIGTDESWTMRDSFITFADIYDGQHEDRTLPDTAPVPARLCHPAKGELLPRLSPRLTVHREITPTLLVTPRGEKVLDLGQNATFTFRTLLDAPKGREVVLKVGETLQDGCFYNDNLRSAKAEYRFISCGIPETVEPRFTFYGGRYLLVEGIDEPRPEDFTFLCLTSELETIGLMETGDPLIDQLISNISWGLMDNFADVPTDCPQRDERMGWTGDAQVFSPTACLLRDAYPFYRKYLYDMATEQAENHGAVPDVIPSFDVKSSCSVWGDATTIIPWNVYRATGDLAVLREHFPAMKAWVDYIRRLDGADFHWRDIFHYGDWLALDLPGAPTDNTRGNTDEGFIADVHYMYSAEITADTARLLDFPEDESTYRAIAEEIRARILREYFTATGRCAVQTQTGLLLTLAHHLSDEEIALRSLRGLLDKSRGKLQTGFVGTPLICRMLSRHGMHDTALKLLLNEGYPGWLFAVKMGATTVWERWNSIDETGHISSTGMNSLNHYSYGAVYAWMSEYLAGFRPDAPGCTHAVLEPRPAGELSFMNYTYTSAAGRWDIRWKLLSGHELAYHVTVPFGCTAELLLPEQAPLSLTAGSYDYTVKTEASFYPVLNCDLPAAELASNTKAWETVLSFLPGAEQLPEHMRANSLRNLLSNRENASELIARIDEALAAL